MINIIYTFRHCKPDVSTLRLAKMKLHSDKNLPLRTRGTLVSRQNNCKFKNDRNIFREHD